MRAGLLECFAKTDARFLPEDVYLRLRSGSAWAYDVDGIGFIVLTQEYDPDGLVLFVWALWCERGKLLPIVGEFYQALETLAREAKAKRIRMSSPRKGYERNPFFHPTVMLYEHEVT